jgi:hypothetical protein
MTKLYVFTVNQSIKYEPNSMFDIYVIRHGILQYGIYSLVGFTSSIYKRDDPIQYHIGRQEVWQLTDDEVNDMLIEVI